MNIWSVIGVLAFLIIAGIGLCALLAPEERQRKPDEAAIKARMEARQKAVREWMQREGIRPIDKREWVSSAHEAPSLQKKARVVLLRGAKR